MNLIICNEDSQEATLEFLQKKLNAIKSGMLADSMASSSRTTSLIQRLNPDALLSRIGLGSNGRREGEMFIDKDAELTGEVRIYKLVITNLELTCYYKAPGFDH
jgi:hypothetical protein